MAIILALHHSTLQELIERKRYSRNIIQRLRGIVWPLRLGWWFPLASSIVLDSG